MPRYYLDSSALVKRYLDEPGTEQVLGLCAADCRLAVSRLTLVEVASAAARRARRGELSADLLQALLQSLEEDFRQLFEVVELTGAILTRSMDVVRAHALRAADGIQLASALACATGGAVTLVSSDAELNAAAAAEHMAVLDPLSE